MIGDFVVEWFFCSNPIRLSQFLSWNLTSTRWVSCFQTHCQANLYGIGRNERLFENASSFRPDRWLHDHSQLGRLNNLTSLAFGHGNRMCLGYYSSLSVWMKTFWYYINAFRIYSSQADSNIHFTYWHFDEMLVVSDAYQWWADLQNFCARISASALLLDSWTVQSWTRATFSGPDSTWPSHFTLFRSPKIAFAMQFLTD